MSVFSIRNLRKRLIFTVRIKNNLYAANYKVRKCLIDLQDYQNNSEL